MSIGIKKKALSSTRKDAMVSANDNVVRIYSILVLMVTRHALHVRAFLYNISFKPSRAKSTKIDFPDLTTHGDPERESCLLRPTSIVNEIISTYELNIATRNRITYSSYSKISKCEEVTCTREESEGDTFHPIHRQG